MISKLLLENIVKDAVTIRHKAAEIASAATKYVLENRADIGFKAAKGAAFTVMVSGMALFAYELPVFIEFWKEMISGMYGSIKGSYDPNTADVVYDAMSILLSSAAPLITVSGATVLGAINTEHEKYKNSLTYKQNDQKIY